MNKYFYRSGLTVLLFLGTTTLSFANVNMLKAYREANPDLKADCMYCHVDKVPKKEDGKHELNVYGKKVQDAVDAKKEGMSPDQLKELYTSVFKQLGRHDAVSETGK